VLAGRDPECRLIDSLVDGAREGRSQALTVLGEAGIGKFELSDRRIGLPGTPSRSSGRALIALAAQRFRLGADALCACLLSCLFGVSPVGDGVPEER
jgi:hypothetical protein